MPEQHFQEVKCIILLLLPLYLKQKEIYVITDEIHQDTEQN